MSKVLKNLEYIEQKSQNIFKIRIKKDAPVCEQWVFLRSDAHHDNKMCNRKLEKEHLDLAVERDAIVLDGGDLFCAMQGRHDKRRSEEALRKEYRGKSNYFDLLINEAAEFYSDYADRMLVFGKGNHETTIRKNNGIDLTENLVYRLNNTYNGNCKAGGFNNYIRFSFESNGNNSHIVTLFECHGYGGGGVVTDGVMQFKRTALHHEADIIWMGHIHKLNNSTHVRKYLNTQLNLVQKKQSFLRTGTYKDEYQQGEGGWSVEKGMGPVPLGGQWIYFRWDSKKINWSVMEAT